MEQPDRIDTYPTHFYRSYRLRPGRPLPFGATAVPGGVNFSIFSRHANLCTLVLFEKGAARPMVEIPFRGFFTHAITGEPFWGDFRIGNVFTMTVFGLDYENIEYGFRMDGPYPRGAPGQPAVHRFNPANILLDPYARAIGGREVWGKPPDGASLYPHRARLVYDDFDWGSDRPLETPIEDLVIYEMHVRGFTRHPSSGARHPGTFAGVREKIPYLLDLGVNCVELMPIFEFDELEGRRAHPETGAPLLNYWGYSTIGFFAPKAGYATGKARDGTMVMDELKTLIKELHASGIEVFLDVVVNHTAEGGESGPTLSYRGIDNATYYLLTPDGRYANFSGTGNTLNCNNPIVRNISQGVPMLLMGDEAGRSQAGNNNAYCHDSPLAWLDWSLLEQNADLFRFTRRCIAFRKAHPVLRSRCYLKPADPGCAPNDAAMVGAAMVGSPSRGGRDDYELALLLDGSRAASGESGDDFICILINAYWEARVFDLPRLPAGSLWRVFVNTSPASPQDCWEPGSEPVLDAQDVLVLGPRSVAVLAGR